MDRSEKTRLGRRLGTKLLECMDDIRELAAIYPGMEAQLMQQMGMTVSQTMVAEVTMFLKQLGEFYCFANQESWEERDQ